MTTAHPRPRGGSFVVRPRVPFGCPYFAAARGRREKPSRRRCGPVPAAAHCRRSFVGVGVRSSWRGWHMRLGRGGVSLPCAISATDVRATVRRLPPPACIAYGASSSSSSRSPPDSSDCPPSCRLPPTCLFVLASPSCASTADARRRPSTEKEQRALTHDDEARRHCRIPPRKVQHA